MWSSMRLLSAFLLTSVRRKCFVLVLTPSSANMNLRIMNNISGMKKLFYLIIALAATFVTSCQIDNAEVPVNENENAELVPMSFTAVLPGSKTSLVDGTKLTWKTTDKISVFSLPHKEGTYTGSKATFYDFSVFTPDAAGSTTTISGTIVPNEWDEYYAVYPSTEGTNDSNASWQERNDFMQINVSSSKETTRTIRHAVPRKQSGTGEENVLIAKYDKEKQVFDFTIETSLFKFTVPAELDGKLSKIVLLGQNNEQVVAWSNTNVTSKNMSLYESSYFSDVYMENADGIPAGTYYFVVLPRTYSKGVSIVTYDMDGEIFNSKDYPNSINMMGTGASSTAQYGGKILNLGTLPAEKNSVEVTILASWKSNDYAHAQAKSPDWSSSAEASYVSGGKSTGVANPEEEGSGAFMRWSCVSGKTPSLLIVGDPDGHYAVRYVGTGDAFEYSIPVPASGFKEGAVIRYQTGYGGGVKDAPKYWRIRYSLDNGTNWAFAETGTDQKTLSNGEIYNLAPLTAVKGYVSVNASFTLPSNLAAGKTILIRHECADGTTGISSSPVGKGNVRLTPFTDYNGEAQAGPMITIEY